MVGYRQLRGIGNSATIASAPHVYCLSPRRNSPFPRVHWAPSSSRSSTVAKWLICCYLRSSVHGYLWGELEGVQEYVDRIVRSDESRKASDIEVKYGNHVYVVRMMDGAPHIMIPTGGMGYYAGDDYLTSGEKQAILALARSTPSACVIEISSGQEWGSEALFATSRVHSQEVQFPVSVSRSAGDPVRQQTPYRCQSRNHGLCASISSCRRFAAARSLALSGLISSASNISSSCSMSSIVRSMSIPSQYATSSC